jgi:hypothetical protein
MVRAALSGAVDFSQASATDAGWWRRTNVLLDELASREDADLLAEAYQYHLALMGNSALTDDSFNRAKKSALETFTEIFNLAHPWETTSLRQMRQQQLGKLTDSYRRVFGGDPSDPTFRARLEADVAETMRKHREGTKKVSPTDALNQKLIADLRRRQQRKAR